MFSYYIYPLMKLNPHPAQKVVYHIKLPPMIFFSSANVQPPVQRGI